MDDSTPVAPPAPSADERNWAAGAHLSALATFVGIPSFVGPLVVWLLKKDESPFVKEHARQALNFNLAILLYLVVAGIVAFVVVVITLGLAALIFIPVALIALVFWIVVLIQAAQAASRGQHYVYPLTINFIN